MSEDLPKSISTWLTRIQEQSKRYEQTVTQVAETIELVETSLQEVGGLGEVLRWFRDPGPTAGFDEHSHHGLQMGSVNGRAVVFYARGIARDGKVIAQGSWAVLRSCDVYTQSNVLQFFPEFLRSVYADFEERTERLTSRLNKISKVEPEPYDAKPARPGQRVSLLDITEMNQDIPVEHPAPNGQPDANQPTALFPGAAPPTVLHDPTREGQDMPEDR